MTDLRENKKEAIETFKLKMCGLPRVVSKTQKSYFQPIYINDNILNKYNVNLHSLICEGQNSSKMNLGFFRRQQ